MVLAYDLLEDRRTIDVITTKFFTLCFKMAENFENLDNILRDWAKDKVQESVVEALNRYEKELREKKDKAVFILENASKNILEQSQSAVERG